MKTKIRTLFVTFAAAGLFTFVAGCEPGEQFQSGVFEPEFRASSDAQSDRAQSDRTQPDLEIGTTARAASVGSLPIHVQRYGPFGNGGTLSTGFPSSAWIATVVGIKTTNGDINEVGTGDPLFAYPFQSNGIWNVTFDLRSHRVNESWEIWVMFINRSMATSTGF